MTENERLARLEEQTRGQDRQISLIFRKLDELPEKLIGDFEKLVSKIERRIEGRNNVCEQRSDEIRELQNFRTRVETFGKFWLVVGGGIWTLTTLVLNFLLDKYL